MRQEKSHENNSEIVKILTKIRVFDIKLLIIPDLHTSGCVPMCDLMATYS